MLGQYSVLADPAKTRQKIILLDFNLHPRRLAAAAAAQAHLGLPADFAQVLDGPPPPAPAGACDAGHDAPPRMSRMKVVRVPTVVRGHVRGAASPFAEDVRSELPYVRTEVVIDGFGRASEFMIDGERLLQLSVRFL